MLLKRTHKTFLSLFLSLFCVGASLAQSTTPEVQIKTQAVAGKVSVLLGQGGNIAVFAVRKIRLL